LSAQAKIHQALFEEWTIRIADQASSGLTVREWCKQNNLTIHKYNYWKHIIKESLTDQVLPDIVPVSIPNSFLEKPVLSHDSSDSPNSCNDHSQHPINNTIAVTVGEIRIEITSADIPLLPDIIKAVRYA